MEILKQAWWAPLAGLLVIAELLVAQAFIFGNGTSNLLDAESTAAGTTLSLLGAAALIAGLWIRPKISLAGTALIVAGAALAGIWFWTVVMTPLAIIVIAGALISESRSA